MPFIVCDCPCTYGREGQCELEKGALSGIPYFCPKKRKTASELLGRAGDRTPI